MKLVKLQDLCETEIEFTSKNLNFMVYQKLISIEFEISIHSALRKFQTKFQKPISNVV